MYFIAQDQDGYYEFVIGTEDVLDGEGKVVGTQDVIYRIPTTRSIWCGTDKYGHGAALMGVDTTGWDIFWHCPDSCTDTCPIIACQNFVAKNKAMLSTRCPELAACCVTVTTDDDNEYLAIDYTGDKLAIKDAKTSGSYVGMEDTLDG